MEKDIQLHFDFKAEQKFLKVLNKVLNKSTDKGDLNVSMFISSVLNYYKEFKHIEFHETNLISIHNAIVDYGGFFNLNYAIKYKTLAVQASRIIERSPSGKPIIVRF